MGWVNGWFFEPSAGIPEIPYEKTVKVALDGVVEDGEYAASQSIGPNWTVSWVHDGKNIYMAIATPGSGWIGGGFLPADAGRSNLGAYLVMVGDEKGKVFARNVYGSGDQVLEQPGTSPQAGLKRNKDGSVAEFVIPLQLPPGEWDLRSLQSGKTYRFLAAFQDTSSVFISYHGKNRQSFNVRIGQ
jgi:hypothetical protein